MIEKAKILGWVLGGIAFLASSHAQTTMTLQWDASPDAVQGYKLYSIHPASSQTNSVNVGNATSAVVASLMEGETYRFFATAYDANGVESGPSNVIDYTVPKPAINPSHVVGSDVMTRGDWKGIYGAEGALIAAAGGQMPTYVSIRTTAAQWTWSSNSTSRSAAQRPGSSSGRISSCWYSAAPMLFDVYIIDNQPHRLSMYFVDASNSGRDQTVDLIDPETGFILDSQRLRNFATGVYLTWEVAQTVQIRITPHNVNAVVSGIFLDASTVAPTVQFVEVDSVTRGNWTTKFGAEGSIIAGDSSFRTPDYAGVKIFESSQWTYGTDGRDSRALLTNDGASRKAGVWYSYYPTTNSFYVDINMTDASAHQVAVYALDWYNQGRSLQVDVLNPATSAVLDRRQLASYGGGQYLVWDVSGSVRLRISTLNGANAMISGIFFGPPSSIL
ncbi:MAG TPA: fibronectin type III domain-containing protein [Verrucomicrobiae bacterium]|nr:fibronectin type III domain-containing protein [Verrucomicrobiae bacterium]